MKLKGDEIVCLYAKEDNGESKFTISFLKLEQLINSYILNRILDELKVKSNFTKYNTEYLSIERLNIKKGTKVNLRFKAYMKETLPVLEKLEYEATIKETDIIEFYNHIVKLFEGYAYELDTEIDNMILELKDIEILDVCKKEGE